MEIKEMMNGNIHLMDGSLIIGNAYYMGGEYRLTVKQQDGQYAKGWAKNKEQAIALLKEWANS